MQKLKGKSMVSMNFRTYRRINTILLIFFLLLICILSIKLFLFLFALFWKLVLIVFTVLLILMGGARLLNKYTTLVTITCPNCRSTLDEMKPSEADPDKGAGRWRCDRCKKIYREKLFGGWRVHEYPPAQEPDKRVLS